MSNDEAMATLPGATGYFALFGEERRPWLDPDELKNKYQELTLLHHPDRQGSKEREADSPFDSAKGGTFPYSFAQLTEAFRVLSDPKLRIEHLLKIEGHQTGSDQSVPEEFVDWFSEIVGFLRSTNDLLQRAATARNALSKSLLRAEFLSCQKQGEDILARLTRSHREALEELSMLNDLWIKDRAAAIPRLTDLHQRLAYLTRWLEQMRERQFQLSR